MTKRYTVISVPTKDGPTYRIYDRINQCSIEGGFDTQKWAESVAEMMEEKKLMKECCGNCKYNKYSPDGKGMRNGKFYCDNEESLEYGTPTFYDDVCDDFEEKE